MVLPDGGAPQAVTNVEFFDSRDLAMYYLDGLPREEKENKVVAYWPPMRGEVKLH